MIIRFLQALGQSLSRSETSLQFRPHSVSTTLHGLVDKRFVTNDLFDMQPYTDGAKRSPAQERRNREAVSNVIDRLRSEFGPQSMSLGPSVEIPGGYVGAKIAFGRIPDLRDFGSPPTPDDEPHFCTTI